MRKNIENRLNVAFERIRRHLTKYKTFVVKSKKERDRILKKESHESIKIDDKIEIDNLIVIIDCGQYDGKHPKKK